MALPAAPDDALPLEGQRPHGRVVVTALGALLQIIGRRPPAPQNAFLGILVEALLVELRTQIPPVNVTRAPAALGHRRDPRVLLQIRRRLEAFALGTHTGQQPRPQHRPGSGQTGKEFVVRMRRIGRGHLLLVTPEGLLHQLQLPADQLHPQPEAFDQRRFIRHRHGFGHQRQPLFQEFGAA